MKKLALLFLFLAAPTLAQHKKHPSPTPTPEPTATPAPVRLICTEKYRDFRRALIELEVVVGGHIGLRREARIFQRDFKAAYGKADVEQKMAFGSVAIGDMPDELQEEWRPALTALSLLGTDLDAFITLGEPKWQKDMYEAQGKAREALKAMTDCRGPAPKVN